MVDISELRKHEIADQFTELVRDSVSVFEAADILATKYGMLRPEVISIIKEIKGSL